MNTVTAAETKLAAQTMEDGTDEFLLQRVSSSSSKRNAVENLGLVCTGVLLLGAAWGALDLSLATEARMPLSVAACCAVLAGAAFLCRDASESFLRGRRRREQPQRPPASANDVRRKIETQEGEVLDEPRPSTSDRLSTSPSSQSPRCDGGPHGDTTAHEQQPAWEPVTPEPTLRRTSSGTTACKQQSAEKPTTPELSLRRTSRPRKPSQRYSAGDWVL